MTRRMKWDEKSSVPFNTEPSDYAYYTIVQTMVPRFNVLLPTLLSLKQKVTLEVP